MRRKDKPGAGGGQLALSDLTPDVERPEPAELAAALQHHERVEPALREGGPNPLPGEMTDEEWKEDVEGFRLYGPLESWALQQAEAAVEAIVEMLPDYAEDMGERPFYVEA